jgi:prepilin-type N-terminal cleavage/methylation domain-containing protein
MKNKRGVTLTELLIASVLIGIIMLGIVSVDYATRQSHQKTTATGQLAMSTGGMLLDIMKNSSLAVGDAATANNSGIYVSPGGNTACFRQDLLQTPSNYTDDSWICYTESANNLLKCTRTASGDCAAGSSRILGRVITGGFQPQVVNDGRDLYFQVSLTSRTNPLISAGPDNPEYTLRSNRSPLAQGGPISGL